jgi:hypothetical protein
MRESRFLGSNQRPLPLNLTKEWSGVKMGTTVFKGLMASVIVGVSYINTNFSPLFWVLLALIAIDLFLNVHQEHKQLSKVMSAFGGLGVPALIAQHVGLPHFTKVVVILMTLVYVQVVTPQLAVFVSRFKFSKSTAFNVAVQEAAQKIFLETQSQAASMGIPNAVTSEAVGAAQTAVEDLTQVKIGG